jgi:hypothetical protein
LKQIDLNGKSTLSIIRTVRGDGQKGLTVIYPNPSNDGRINITFEDVNTIRDVSIIDINGRTIKLWKGITNNNITVENLLPGFYSVKITDTETGLQVVEKFVVKNR